MRYGICKNISTCPGAVFFCFELTVRSECGVFIGIGNWQRPVVAMEIMKRCAFVGQLQKQMEARRHSRLYLSTRKITAEMRAGRKLNPMRERTAKSKPKPMTATATTLVKSVWMNYFGGAPNDDQGASKNVSCPLWTN